MGILTEQIQVFLRLNYGSGEGDGNGNGCGYGYGYGSGNGEGYGEGGIREYEGNKMYDIDGIPTAITFVRGNIAKGFILENNTFRKPCYIVKEGGCFAHGDTLHDAFNALQEKLYDDSTEEERIAAFRAKFPDYDTPYANKDLFAYHHVLTGSCRMGRENFIENKGLSLDGKTTVRDFVELTQDAYGGDIIKKLPKAYNKE